MDNVLHSVQRATFSKAIDLVLTRVKKDRVKGLLELVDVSEKFLGDDYSKETYDNIRAEIQDPDSKWMHYINRVLDETHPNVVKMNALNLGFEAAFRGTKVIRKMRKEHN